MEDLGEDFEAETVLHDLFCSAAQRIRCGAGETWSWGGAREGQWGGGGGNSRTEWGYGMTGV